MKRYIFYGIFSIACIAFNKTYSQAVFDKSYKPPVFADANRLEKIKNAFPVIDSIF